MTNFVLPKLLTVEMLKSSGIHIGALTLTIDMQPFVESVSPEGVTYFDLNKTLERIDVAGSFISKSEPARVLVFSALEKAEKTIPQFSSLTRCRGIYGRMVPGTLTNPAIKDYVDAELLVITDPTNGAPKPEDEGMVQKKGEARAVDEASDMGIPVVAVCNSGATLRGVDLVIPANNRGNRALAVLFYLLARSVLLHRDEIRPSDEIGLIEEFETPLEEKEVEEKPVLQPSPSTP